MRKKLKKIKQFIKRTIKNNIYRVSAPFFRIFPINNKKVLFLSDKRSELDGNFEYLYNYIKDKDYKIITDLLKISADKRTFKQKVKLLREIATSKYILLDDWTRSISQIKPRKGQEYVQLWHAEGAFKTFGDARPDKGKRKKNSGHKNYTKAIVSAEEIRKCYADSYGISIDKVKATGIPRTDIFFDEDYKKKVINEFYEEFPNLKNKKIILFAPTLRTLTTKVSTAYYDFEMLDLEKLKKNFGDDYVFIIKWHPFVSSKLKSKKLRFNYDEKDDFILDLSSKREINDLLFIADILITDYSSVVFNYYLMNKPVVYYTYDLDHYLRDRGFYFPFKDYIYGEIASNPDELVSAIKSKNLCKDKRKEFGKKFMEACDGKATEKTYKYIFEEK